MAKNIHVVKITASATANAWAQSYHAGNLTAVVTASPKGDEDPTSLHIVGKDLLNTFESEYFTIENKTLSAIKDAVETTCQKSSSTHDISFLVGSLVRNTLYVVLAGKGSIFLIRQGKLGTLLEQTDSSEILSSSGFLEHGDIIILASSGFLELVNKEVLFNALENNSSQEAAELLSPKIHAASLGDAAAVFFQYEDDIPPTHEKSEENIHESSPVPQINEMARGNIEHMQPEMATFPHHASDSLEPIQKEEPIFSEPLMPSARSRGARVSHGRWVLLTIIIVIVIVLGGTIYFAMSHQQQTKNTSLFDTTYPQAEQKYEEAQGLMELNPLLAAQDLKAAQQQLEPLSKTLLAGSSQQEQAQELLAKIQAALTTITSQNSINATKVNASTSPLLSYANLNADKPYLTEDATNIYAIDSTGITQVTKTTSAAKSLLTNTNAWTSLGGFKKYLDNFYVLDTKAGILKFVPSGATYAKSNYFTSNPPDLSNAVDMAIDFSIWVLQKDGSILKFTRGKQDELALSGLDTPLSSPSKIITSVDLTNVYILDNGNGRIVQIDKTGKFLKSYSSTLLKKATQFVVDEKAKTTTFLSSGGFYQISLQ